jgi:putative ABC transport system ATP-binding protein
VAAALEAVGLAAFGQHRPDQLSGGQRQRVAIARAIVKHPRLVIADEPSANLDAVTAAQIVALMQRLAHEHGTTFLIATHDESCCPTATAPESG